MWSRGLVGYLRAELNYDLQLELELVITLSLVTVCMNVWRNQKACGTTNTNTIYAPYNTKQGNSKLFCKINLRTEQHTEQNEYLCLRDR